MTTADDRDILVDQLKRLVPLVPDEARSVRLRSRCRVRLSARAGRRARIGRMRSAVGQLGVPLVIGATCLVYLVALVTTTLRFEGVLR